jgi:hypothetical protein
MVCEALNIARGASGAAGPLVSAGRDKNPQDCSGCILKPLTPKVSYSRGAQLAMTDTPSSTLPIRS